MRIFELVFENACNLFIEHVQNIPFIIFILYSFRPRLSLILDACASSAASVKWHAAVCEDRRKFVIQLVRGVHENDTKISYCWLVDVLLLAYFSIERGKKTRRNVIRQSKAAKRNRFGHPPGLFNMFIAYDVLSAPGRATWCFVWSWFGDNAIMCVVC